MDYEHFDNGYPRGIHTAGGFFPYRRVAEDALRAEPAPIFEITFSQPFLDALNPVGISQNRYQDDHITLLGRVSAAKPISVVPERYSGDIGSLLLLVQYEGKRYWLDSDYEPNDEGFPLKSDV